MIMLTGDICRKVFIILPAGASLPCLVTYPGIKTVTVVPPFFCDEMFSVPPHWA